MRILGYGFFSSFYLFFCKLITYCFYPKIKIIRFPFFFRGSNHIFIGEDSSLGVGCRIESYLGGTVSIGKNVQINDYLHIGCTNSVIIEDNCLLASKVFITDHNHGSTSNHDILLQPKLRGLSSAPVKINTNVWIGENVSILPGVVIGESSIIGAGSVVTKNIPPFSIACGVPAKVIKRFDRDLNKWIKEN
ncbi:DapH/DapD/GlmU-related protein [uncultured Tolumonas sp.]|uniref:DapH/DapD/GlmU-related protein n=1 Tax=uncultured Tolumonas sp. TaxID=263765 RepID=UPI002931EA08|nr:DapH/DapD/GlmU-related protein [uncultured Tolumonas sp.]